MKPSFLQFGSNTFSVLIILTVLFCTISLSSSAQKSPIEWGKIPPPDILMTTYEADTSAEAVVLCDYTFVGISSSPGDYAHVHHRHRRVKILKRSAFGRGDISIPFYKKDGLETITNLKAQIISPAGQITQLGKGDFFREEVSDYLAAHNFSFPNLQEGCIIEYKYELNSKYMSELGTWYFQEDIPVRRSEYQIKNESRFSYLLLFEGGDNMESSPLPGGGTLLQRGNTTFRVLDDLFIMENAPGLQPEAYITTMNDYRARIRFQLNEIIHSDGHKEGFISTWNELADKLMRSENFGERFHKKKNYKKLLEAARPLVNTATTKGEKVKAIYNFIANNVSWNKSYGVFTDRTLDKAFETKTARACELNMMCLALLNHFEIPATPILTSTRRHGKMNQKYPLIDQFNHLMVLIELDGKSQIMDVGDPLRPMGLPREVALNKMAWKVDKERPNWVSLHPILSKETMSGELTFSPEGHIKGKIRTSNKAYSAYDERSALRENKKASFWKERLEANFEEIQIDSVSFKNAQIPDKDLSTTLHFTSPNAIDTDADFIYFSPVIFTNYDENPFKLKERTYPIDFPYIFEEKYTMSIKIPEGFEVEELPETIDHKLLDDKGRFIFVVKQKDDRIQVISQLSISRLLYTPNEYQAIKNIFDMVVEKHGEQIVFKRKT